MPSNKDKAIIADLAARIAEIAALPIHAEKQALWRKLNARKADRPMVMIDQVCWNEMNINDELTLRCEDAECRRYEQQLRRTLYQWHHFPVDMVVEPFIGIPKAVTNTGFGLRADEQVAVTDPTNDVVGHQFANQLAHDDDLEKIKTPVVGHNTQETERRMAVAHELFDGTLNVVARGYDPCYMTVWDPISFWMGVENALYAIIDRPDFMMAVVKRAVAGNLALLDQLEAQDLLCGPQSLIHCTGAWTDVLPASGSDPAHPRVKDLWLMSMAQMFSTVSPAMHDEYEIEPCMPLFERFGQVYYGCCEPLDRKLDIVRKIPNLCKISMSPWVDVELGAAGIGGDYVYSRKPNPALLAWHDFDEQAVRDHLKEPIDACRRHGCSLELILKDISTVKYQPQRLFRWAEIAMELVQQ